MLKKYSSQTQASTRTVAICGGSGGSMLTERDAEVYWTGKMSHVRIYPVCVDSVLIPR